jgi:hypothetical protein
VAGVIQELAWSPPLENLDTERPVAGPPGQLADRTPAGTPPASVPLIEDGTLQAMIDELYAALSLASFVRPAEREVTL